jgi:hypothetical protein
MIIPLIMLMFLVIVVVMVVLLFNIMRGKDSGPV